VQNAISQTVEMVESNPYRHQFADGLASTIDSVRESIAAFAGAHADEIFLFPGATRGMNAIAGSLGLRPGDRVLTGNHEHPGGLAAWRFLVRHHGLKATVAQFPASLASQDEAMQCLETAWTDDVRVVSLCHVDPVAGFVMPLSRIAAAARERGAFFVCDCAQSAGMIRLDLGASGVDVAVASGHKWMLGPKGTGFVYLRRESRPRIRSVELADPRVYSASGGTPALHQAAGLDAAVAFSGIVGRERIESRIRELADLLIDRIRDIPPLTLLTPDDEALRGGIVTAAIDPQIATQYSVWARLENESGILVRPVELADLSDIDPRAELKNYNALRFSTHIFNDEEHVDRLARALEHVLA
jgi:selenocysteine lyase/cysteine desulfurase